VTPTSDPPRSTNGATALGFPGQGGDWRAAVATLVAHPTHPLVAALADRLGTDRWDALDGLDTRNAQPAIYVSGLIGEVADNPPPDVVAVIGHSLGEITASAWAGALDPLGGLDLTMARGRLGHDLHQARPGAMAAINRWDAAQVEWLRRRILADAAGILDVAVTNSSTQLVLSGDTALVLRAIDLANEQGAVARLLPIGGAYHSPLMSPAVERFAALAAAAVIADPRVPVVCSTSRRAHTSGAELAEVVVRSLVLPVDWPAAVQVAADLGATRMVEAGPGDTLGRLGRFLPALEVTAP